MIDLDEYRRQAESGLLVPCQMIALIDELTELRGLARRAITYAHEDRMTTPGVTRLRRVLDAMERATKQEEKT